MITTLNKIREHRPCDKGWEKLLRHLGKTKADDEPLNIATIIDSNGLDDALWCLQAVEGYDREIRLFAVWCARRVQHLMNDPRSIAAIETAERYANGQATDQELAFARYAAWDAARYSENYSARCAACHVTSCARYAVRFAALAARDAAQEDTWDVQTAELRRICLNFPIATNPTQPTRGTSISTTATPTPTSSPTTTSFVLCAADNERGLT